MSRHRAGKYVLCYPGEPPKPPYTRIVKLAIAAADYEDLAFTINEAQPLEAHEADAYCAVRLPKGLRLVHESKLIQGQDGTYIIRKTREAPPGDSD